MATTIQAPNLEEDVVFSQLTTKLILIVLLLDLSRSMWELARDGHGKEMRKIDGLRLGLKSGHDYLHNDPMLREAVRINYVYFGRQVESTGFKKLEEDPKLPEDLGGGTALNQALTRGCEDVESYFFTQNEMGVSPSQCTFLLISDGKGGDGPCDASMKRLLDLQAKGLVNPTAAGMNEKDDSYLESLGFKERYRLDQLSWTEIIQTATVSAKQLAMGQHAASIDMVGEE